MKLFGIVILSCTGYVQEPPIFLAMESGGLASQKKDMMHPTHLKFDYERFNENAMIDILGRYGEPSRLRLLYLSTYHENYTRTESLLQLFDDLNLNYVKSIKKGFFKYFLAILTLIANRKNTDVVFVAFRGQELLPLVKLFTRQPIVFDAFVSVYDTLCLDRKIFHPDSIAGRLCRLYDKILCKLSDTVLVDTQAHQNFFQKICQYDNIDYLYVGCNRKVFAPPENRSDENTTTVFWYGAVNPLQGVDIILRAAKLLEAEQNIRFKIVGPVRTRLGWLVKELSSRNIEFADFMPYKKLPEEIGRADIFLGGHFSDIDKARRVIAGKTFQALCCKTITIVGDNPANRELFNDTGLVTFVKMNDPVALASKIKTIAHEIQ